MNSNALTAFISKCENKDKEFHYKITIKETCQFDSTDLPDEFNTTLDAVKFVLENYKDRKIYLTICPFSERKF